MDAGQTNIEDRSKLPLLDLWATLFHSAYGFALFLG
jgi:hypothetical protein